MTTLALLFLGLVLLLGGGHALVVGASSLARGLGVSSLVVGLTVVAFGTSAPELAVSLDAALSGRGGIVFGNVVGSNLANLGLILGIGALLRPMVIESRILARELPLMLLATVAAAVLGLDTLILGEPAAFDRADGLVLLLFFSVFLYVAIGDVVRRKPADALAREVEELPLVPTEPTRPVGRSVALTVAGLGALVVGGDVTVDAAATIARDLGVSEAVIGLSIVAIGTSLPELVASLIAAVRGEADLAVGNVVGSNIFNLLFILGTTATVRSVPVPDEGWIDLAALTVLSVGLLLAAGTHRRRIVRWEAAVGLLAWAAYTGWRCLGSPA